MLKIKIEELSMNNEIFSEILKRNLEYYKFKSAIEYKNELHLDEYIICIIMPIRDFQITIKLTNLENNILEYEMFGKIQSGEFKQDRLYLARIYIKDKTICYYEKLVEAYVMSNPFSCLNISERIANTEEVNKICNRIVFHYFNNCEPNLTGMECVELFI